MEDELKCPSCTQIFCKPLLLQCSHSICTTCASKLQEPAHQLIPQSTDEGSTSQTINELDYPEIDKLSILSETDSGVVCNSRPNSYVGTPSIGNLYLQSIQGSVFALKCPVCKKMVYMDDSGVKCLPENRVLANIIHKYSENKPVTIKCQLCEDGCNEATAMCEQCEVFYCDTCRDSCHPSRGPLAKHNLVDPTQGKALLRAKTKGQEAQCSEHTDEHLSMFCVMCRIPVCYVCAHDGQHINHDVQALGAMCKSQKAELSQSLQSLSEKARAGTEFIHRLKGMVDRVEGNCDEFRAGIVVQCDNLIEAIKQRKEELIESISEEKEVKLRILKEQVQECTALLQRTTGLLQFSIEVLKESDAMSYLQVSNSLVSRVSSVDENFNKDMELAPRVSPEFELTLDNSAILHAISTLNFFQMKDGIVAPGQPVILPEDCTSENNSVTIAWQPYPGSVVEAFTLELDDGNNGDFRVVYVGREVICTVDGLHFNSIYNARVKAHNHAGEGPYSDVLSLQTAEVAWFTFDPLAAHPDLILSNDNQTVTCNSYEPRVVLGGVGFSKGVHYWEVYIDRYDNHADPAFGIARFDTSKNVLLGKDDKAWSMYVDYRRSWFIHRDQHSNRTDGGIQKGSIVGILLDLNRNRLSYFINDEPHGPIAFNNLHGVFFPAVSINRNVQVTLRTGIAPPVESESDEEE